MIDPAPPTESQITGQASETDETRQMRRHQSEKEDRYNQGQQPLEHEFRHRIGKIELNHDSAPDFAGHALQPAPKQRPEEYNPPPNMPVSPGKTSKNCATTLRSR